MELKSTRSKMKNFTRRIPRQIRAAAEEIRKLDMIIGITESEEQKNKD